MKESRFSQAKNTNKNSGLPIFQLVFMGLVITGLATIFVQNLQPTVQLIFLGQMTVAIPLSVTMLAAFAIGGILAFTFNSITAWRQNLLIRRALADVKVTNSNESIPRSVTQNSSEDYEEYDEEEADEDFDDDFSDDDQVYEEDPDTLPYGDRFKKKSTVEPKDSYDRQGDRPPLDAKYIN
ncbi:MAG: hypothetical protein DCE90_03060 [Pseudanabaena sp.]|nr:MAG: hypothetical protein DCE90_03060 [Pseudanabaena sp.]